MSYCPLESSSKSCVTLTTPTPTTPPRSHTGGVIIEVREVKEKKKNVKETK